MVTKTNFQSFVQSHKIEMLSVVWKYSGNILVIKLPYCARSSVSLVNFRLSSDPRSTVSDRASVEVLLVVFVLLVISLRQFYQRTQKSSWDLMAKVNSIKIKKITRFLLSNYSVHLESLNLTYFLSEYKGYVYLLTLAERVIVWAFASEYCCIYNKEKAWKEREEVFL